MSGTTKIIAGPFHTRRKARSFERSLQNIIEGGAFGEARVDGVKVEIPSWANGARVEKVGFLQYAVVATSHKGH